MDELRYPIGHFEAPVEITSSHVGEWIAAIEAHPAQLRARVEPLTAAQLDTPYRPEGWTVRQVVHHLADSHMNSVVRFKWALTEPRPTIKAYDEVGWAKLDDYTGDVALSLDLLAALHRRWVRLLGSLGAEDLGREFVHPASGPISLAENIGVYAWHGRHHLAHIESLAHREGW